MINSSLNLLWAAGNKLHPKQGATSFRDNIWIPSMNISLCFRSVDEPTVQLWRKSQTLKPQDNNTSWLSRLPGNRGRAFWCKDEVGTGGDAKGLDCFYNFYEPCFPKDWTSLVSIQYMANPAMEATPFLPSSPSSVSIAPQSSIIHGRLSCCETFCDQKIAIFYRSPLPWLDGDLIKDGLCNQCVPLNQEETSLVLDVKSSRLN